ncbi:MAG TPA: glycosyltransferase family 2 protein [Phycisphaerales bacterium]|nr:glycosyltransferase family 2 protein [Phycisphaerales bacterium]
MLWAPHLRTLVAIPVFNEARYVRAVLDRVLTIHPDVLVIDDGSSDATPTILTDFRARVGSIRHAKNMGYGQSMIDAFAHAKAHGFDWLITMDCDEQHEPAAIPHFIDEAARNDADIISGSRYLAPPPAGQAAPPERRAVNATITAEINARLSRCLGALLTDTFCGFKAYRVAPLADLCLTETGYAFPMQFWAQAAAHRLRVREMPVKLIYNDPNRSFGAVLDDPTVRLAHYRKVLHDEILAHASCLPPRALAGLLAPGEPAPPSPCVQHRAHRTVHERRDADLST